MHEYTNDLFSLSRVTYYDDGIRKRVEKYKYYSFSQSLMNKKEEDLESFFSTTINVLNSKRELIKKLRSISLDVIKDDIGLGTYEILRHGGIANIYELRLNIHRNSLKRIYCKVRGIGPTKGKKIIGALEKHGLYTNIYVDYL